MSHKTKLDELDPSKKQKTEKDSGESANKPVPPSDSAPTEVKKEDKMVDDPKLAEPTKANKLKQWEKLKELKPFPKGQEGHPIILWLKDHCNGFNNSDVDDWLSSQRIFGDDLCTKVEAGEDSFIKWAKPELVKGPATKLYNALDSFVVKGQIPEAEDSLFSNVDNFLFGDNDNGVTESDSMYLSRDSLVEQIVARTQDIQKLRCRTLLKAPPASGKTSVLQQVIRRLRKDGREPYLLIGRKLKARGNYLEHTWRVDRLPVNSVVVIDDIQVLFGDKFVEDLLKNTRHIHVIAAAAYDLVDQIPDTPVQFSEEQQVVFARRNIGVLLSDRPDLKTLQLCLSTPEAKTMSDNFFISQQRLYRHLTREAFDEVVTTVAALTNVDLSPEDDKEDDEVSTEEDVKAEDDSPTVEQACHIGLYRFLLEGVVRLFYATTHTAPDVAKIRIFLTGSQLLHDLPTALKRAYSSLSPLVEFTDETKQELQMFFISGKVGLETLRKARSLASVTSKPAKVFSESSNPVTKTGALYNLLRASVIVQIGSSVRFTSSISQRWFFDIAFGSRAPQSYRPSLMSQFVLDVCCLMSPLRFKDAAARGFPVETAIQEFFFSGMLQLTPVDWFLSPERRIVNKDTKRTGRIDFQVKDWGIELLVNGNRLSGHHRKMGPNGKYRCPDITKRIVVDIRAPTFHKPSAAAAQKHSLLSGAEHIALQLQSDFRSCSVYRLAGATWQSSSLKLGQELSSVLSGTLSK